MGTILGIVVGLLILSIMMLVHELGHFLAGKALGFKIISFNLFMGPVLWSKKGKDGVTYTLRLVPMGASVEFAGENSGINELPEEEEAEETAAEVFDPEDPSLFFNRPRWARAIVVFMGPLFNFITAFLAFALLFIFLGQAIMPIIGEVEPASLAAEQGLEPGDRIIKVNQDAVYSSLDYSIALSMSEADSYSFMVKKADGSKKEIQIVPEYVERYRLGISYDPTKPGMAVTAVDPLSNAGQPVLEVGDNILSLNGISSEDDEAFTAEIEKNGGEEVILEISRRGEVQEISMKLTLFQDQVPLGIFLRPAENLAEALGQAAVYPLSVVKSTFKGLRLMFSGAISAKEGLTGPIGIVNMVGGVVKTKISLADKIQQLITLFGLISVAVGFTNLLPIPPFDGFHLLVLGVEGLIRRDLPMKVKEGFAAIGLILVLLLVVYVFYIDISRIISFW